MSDHTRARSYVRAHATSCLLAVLVLLAAAVSGSATAATSSTVVGATVPSATSIAIAGCQPNTPSVTDFGVVMPGASVVTGSDCVITWGSSNDTASLRIAESDGGGTAMNSMSDGSLDTAFGTGGIATTNLGGTESAEALLELDDGRTVVATQRGTFVGMARYAADGSPDPTFNGASGTVEEDVGISIGVFGLLELADGSYLVLLDASGVPCTAMRVTAAGAFDMTWSGDGYGDLPIDCGGDPAHEGGAFALQSDGKIVVGGTIGLGGQDSAIARMNADGTLDTTFGTGGTGYWTADIAGGSVDRFYDVHVFADDTILATGIVNGSTGNVVVTAFSADGQLDTSYSGDGYSNFTVDNVQGSHLLPRPGGGVFVVGTEFGNDAIVVAIDAAGDLDTSWSSDGYELVDVGGTDFVFGALLETDGRIVVSGSTDADAFVFRLDPSGVLDTTFGTGGIVVTDVGGAGTDAAYSDPVERDGGYHVAGTDDGDAFVARYGSVPIQDYQSGVTDWTLGANMFGACLYSTSAGSTAVWPDSANCAVGDAEWRAIPDSAGTIASTSTSGTTGVTTALRFGLRTASSQPAGYYRAPITFDVVAP